jgi:hypothetical protein
LRNVIQFIFLYLFFFFERQNSTAISKTIQPIILIKFLALDLFYDEKLGQKIVVAITGASGSVYAKVFINKIMSG